MRASALATPILYQYLTDLIFRSLVRDKFDIGLQEPLADTQEMSYDEANVLMYAAGYVVRHTSKIKKKNLHSGKELLSSAQQLLKVSQQATNRDDPGTAKEWTELVDRGGLWHVRETTFHVFCALEEETRPHLGALCSETSTAPTFHTEFFEKLIASEDVQFFWCIAAADFNIVDMDVHDALPSLIADLYLTIRGL